MSSHFTVVYDACVLYPAPLRDLLIHLALSDLFRARWSNMIHDEWIRNVHANRPDLSRDRLDRTRDRMNHSVRDCVVSDFEYMISSISLPDPDDRHVVAAAIHCGASLIVTFNLKDFPDSALTHEDWYPTHHLYLFSQGKNLYCYVELFGTIQKYVHLTNRYGGLPLRQKFVQKAEKWIFDEGMFTAKDPKDLHILAGEFGVEMVGRPWNDIQNDVLHLARIRAYSLEPNDTVEKVRALVGLLAQFSFLKNVEEFEVVQSMFKKASTAKAQLGLSLLDDIKINPMFALRLVQHTFEDFRIGTVKASCPDRAREIPAVDLEKYEGYKFYELLRAKGREAVLQYSFV